MIDPNIKIMKRNVCLALLSLVLTIQCFSQKEKSSKAYVTSGGELIFSLANIEQNGNSENATVRFSPVVNFQVMLNKDINKNFGFFAGLALRNVGYILPNYKDTNNLEYKKKFRSYNIGIPVGLKLGNLEKTFFYGGYEIEFALSYKEKTYEDGDKIDKITGWFSSRQELFQHGFFVGVQFPFATNIKFKYYLSEFHNRDYVNNAGVKPYGALKSNIYYFSICFFLFRNFDLYIEK
jgi:outer membrane protein with beta-barrel domain